MDLLGRLFWPLDMPIKEYAVPKNRDGVFFFRLLGQPNLRSKLHKKRPLLRAAFKFLPKLYGYLFFTFCAANREARPKKK